MKPARSYALPWMYQRPRSGLSSRSSSSSSSSSLAAAPSSAPAGGERCSVRGQGKGRKGWEEGEEALVVSSVCVLGVFGVVVYS